jgi:hypothetical protein
VGLQPLPERPDSYRRSSVPGEASGTIGAAAMSAAERQRLHAAMLAAVREVSQLQMMVQERRLSANGAGTASRG